MPQFTGGPSVRVTANNQIEFKWSTDVAWLGKVDIFDKIDATVPFFTTWAVDGGGTKTQLQDQVAFAPVGGSITPDTKFFFQVTAIDPMDSTATVSFPVVIPWLPVFTGQQALSNVAALSITQTSATVSWNGNMIGTGRVTLNTSAQATDNSNAEAHAIPIGNLTAGTTYQYTAETVNAEDGGVLASSSGNFQTLISTPPPSPTTFTFNEPHAEPRVIPATKSSTVSVRCWNQGNPVVGAAVTFAIAGGSGTLSSSQGTADANGFATVTVTGTARGLVDVQVSSTNATNSPFKIPVVVK